MGMNTGLLDAEALADTLIMVLKEDQSLSLLDIYSDERRKVFQTFVDPVTTNNLLRIQYNTPETVKDDWFFRKLQNMDEKTARELARPFFEVWRTNMRKVLAENVANNIA
jgi:2-polyprenyl-6-methoxyphenol hydroxylase-like FAD-dependent oxidoreductase